MLTSSGAGLPPAWGSAGTALNGTVQVASGTPQTLSATQQFAEVQTSTGATQVNFPTSPTPGMLCGLYDSDGDAATDHISVVPNGVQQIQDPTNPTSHTGFLTIATNNIQALWTFNPNGASGAGLWVLISAVGVSSGGVTSVTGTAPINSSGGTTPAISITAATDVAAGSMSAADKTKLDQLDYPELPGTGTNAYTGTGTIAEIVPTETKLAFGTTYEVDGFAGTLGTTSNTPVTIATIPIPGTGAIDGSISVLAFDSGAAGNVYRTDLTFTAATGVFLPASGNPLNVRSAGTVTGWAATLVQSGSNVLVQVAGISPSVPADPVVWSVIGQIQLDT